MLARRASRLVLFCLIAAIVGLGIAPVGCGDDDDGSGDTTAAEESSALEPLVFDDVQANLEADGYTVKEESSEALIRRDDGEIVQPEAKLVVTGGSLASGAEVSVYKLASPEDIAAMEEFVSGSEESFVDGDVFIQSSDPGAAGTILGAAAN